MAKLLGHDKKTQKITTQPSQDALRDISNALEVKQTSSLEDISEICTNICSGGTPPRDKSDYFIGNIPWLRTQEVNWTEIYDTELKISEEAVKNSSAKIIPSNCVIVAMYGATAAKACINKIELTTNQACCNLQIDSGKALYKYVYYWICNNYITPSLIPDNYFQQFLVVFVGPTVCLSATAS